MKHTSNHWNFFLALFPIIGTFAANAQTITTYDSRPYGAPAVESIYRAVDVGQTNIALNPDYKLKLRSVAVPALWDMRYELGVTITGTVAQAEAELSARIAEQYPANTKFKNKDRRQEARKPQDNIKRQGQLQQRIEILESETKRLAELVESLLEDQSK